MNPLTPLTTGVRFFQRQEAADARRQTRADDLEEPDWAGSVHGPTPGAAPREWRFCCFLLCMAMTALPLLCIRWTSTDAGQRASMVGDAILLALPVALPLPFLLLACISALVFHPASRTRETWASFLAALAIGAAAASALAG